jgi:light-regulated signal transduction histidine kinase (bacteriophytochrome)
MHLEADSVISALVVTAPPVRIVKEKPKNRPSADELLKRNAELEERVREYAARAEAAAKELEGFCYSVSHDLRAPLRSIDGFTHALLESSGESLDPTAREYLQRVRGASQRMGRLIEDLLHLSRVGRKEMRVEEVDLSELAGSVAAQLHKSEPDREVEFVIAPGLHARGDERLLRIALENLFNNAWKFTSKIPKARIEFGRGEKDGQTGFYLRDNGAGFDAAYSEKLFTPFQRLHSANEFPGTGVGLAVVQRIISRHGGRVWAEGAPDQGAAFWFALPD